MAKLPVRQKVNVLCFRRASPDEILVVARIVARAAYWGIPSAEVEDGSSRDAALRLATRVVEGKPLSDIDLGVGAEYRVNSGPRAGEWKEKFHGVEFAPETRALEGRWLPHYEAKTEAGADSPRVREAVSRLRELMKLKP